MEIKDYLLKKTASLVWEEAVIRVALKQRSWGISSAMDVVELSLLTNVQKLLILRYLIWFHWEETYLLLFEVSFLC